ncbi:MAG: ATP-dependent DNA helicase [Methanomassiliicoccales archaeon]|nr:ATP-dependent DNA helicase [Methanomassiliicoccales archaeon]
MELFPYEPRKHQTEIVASVSAALKEGRHVVMESGTGTGKTVCALASSLQVALASGRKVVYLTRTNSQQRQVILELRRINSRAEVFGMGVQGRQSTCPLLSRDPELKQGNAEELSRLCSERKRRSLAGKEGGCRFYDAVLASDFDKVLEHCRRELPTVEEFSQYCDSQGLCPYELGKELLAHATVVTAPYAYFFAPFVREAFVDRMNVPMSELIIVVDEAHNLPDYARESRSLQLSMASLELVLKELEEYGDPEVAEGVSIRDVAEHVRSLLEEAVRDYVIEDDGLIPPDMVSAGLMQAFAITSRQLGIACKAMMTHGEIVRESKKEQGRLPRSFIFSLGAFLWFWLKMDEDCYVKLVVGGENPRFEGFCLDPSLACGFLHECAGSLHMSGTLVPLYEYRDSVGLPEGTTLRAFPSPFDPANRLVLYAEDVTTKYEEMAQDAEIVPRMEDYIVRCCNALDRNTVVFFPSYGLMDRFLEDKVLLRIRKNVYLEERGMPQAELMSTVQSFKQPSAQGQVLFAVMGGRISEGVDFPDRELQVALVAGIPYPKPTAKHRALLHYHEMKFGKGWEYTVKVPAARKMQQCIGRLIRTEGDVGVALVLDRRAKQFEDRMEMRAAEAVPNDLLAFFSSRGA